MIAIDNPSDIFQLSIPVVLVEATPPNVRSDPALLEAYLVRALEIGIKAMAQATVHLDTEIVKLEFARLTTQMESMRKQLEDLLSQELSAEDSCLARGLKEYFADGGHLTTAIKGLVLELGDASRDGSIPAKIRSVLDECFKHASSPFQRALNISDDASPLKRFVLEQERKIQEFQEDLGRKHALLSESIETKFARVFDRMGFKLELDEAEEKGTRKGGVFEDQIVEILSSIIFDKDCAERVGVDAAAGTRDKHGDLLIHIEQEGFNTERIVVEAKAGSYTLGGKEGLLGQLSDAMACRDAAAGIAVVTRQHAGKRQRTFDRLGSNRIVVIVDPDAKDGGYLPLELAYIVLREALLARQRQPGEVRPDFEAVAQTLNDIERNLEGIQGMKRNCTEAKKNVDSVRETIVEIETGIRDQLMSLRRKLRI